MTPSPHRHKRWYKRKRAAAYQKRSIALKRHPIAGSSLRDDVIATGTIGSMLFVQCEQRLILLHEDWL